MMRTARNKADVKHSVMLAVLNFQAEFMKSSHTRAQIHINQRRKPCLTNNPQVCH